ncbi:MAG TPA: hybrid sensor histidine kinase/response regulator, partial [Armatimonadota bacterium]|nr:hybrid sensor histidine kinase/response regulator [Armatimonadota bacterium]
MTDPAGGELEHRVLVLAPTARDAAQSQGILTQAGVHSTVCSSLSDVCREVEAGAAALLLTDEAL